MTPTRHPTVDGQDGTEHITLDDVRHKALAVRDMATEEVRHTVEDRTVQVVIAGAVVVAVAVSLAYYLGTRAAERALTPPRP